MNNKIQKISFFFFLPYFIYMLVKSIWTMGSRIPFTQNHNRLGDGIVQNVSFLLLQLFFSWRVQHSNEHHTHTHSHSHHYLWYIFKRKYGWRYGKSLISSLFCVSIRAPIQLSSIDLWSLYMLSTKWFIWPELRHSNMAVTWICYYALRWTIIIIIIANVCVCSPCLPYQQ